MKNKVSKNILLSYIGIILILVSISLIGLAFKIYEVSVVISISSVFSFIYLLLSLLYIDYQGNKKLGKRSFLIIFMILKFFILILSVFLSLIFLYYSPTFLHLGQYRYLFILFILLPIGITMVLLVFKGKKENGD